MTIAGRNDPCPCGSGKKYKKCCLPRGLKIEPDVDETEEIRTRAFKRMSEQKWEEALVLFKSIESRVRDPFAILWAVAACYDGLEDYLRAAEHFEKALAICPRSRRFDVTYQLGVSRGCAGRVEKSIAAFRECLRMNERPEREEQLLLILDVLEEIRQGKKSPDLFRAQVMLQRALSDMDDKRYESAAGRLETIVPWDPENPAIFYNLGVVYTLLKRESDAMVQYEKTVQLQPDYVQAWYNMGQLCMIKRKDFSRALHCFDQATKIRPDYVNAHHQRGMAWELLGDRDKALEAWKKTLELDPDNKTAKGNIRRLGEKITEHSAPETD